MGFKNYTVKIFLLSLAIILFSLLGAYSIISYWWISSVFFYFLVLISAWQITYFSKNTTRKLTEFFNALRFEDYTVSTSDEFNNKEYNELNKALSQISANFRKINIEREKNLFYLQNIVEHIDIGILAFNLEGKIVLINKALMTTFGIKSIEDVSGFEVINSELYSTFENINPFERRLLNFFYKENNYKLALYATRFSFKDDIVKLISIKNIRTELERQELDSWQKLISVLTHEIMNSIAPISSLSQTLNFMLSDAEVSEDEDVVKLDKEVFTDTKEALNTIHNRSDGLIHFVQTYRNITKIPKPVFELFKISELFKNVYSIFKQDIEANKIEFVQVINPSDLALSADLKLIEQVLINIVKNAIQSIKSLDYAKINLTANINTLGNVELQIDDNGPGILPDVLDKIFIPFFSTKTDGSGIGLSLSRQIINNHGGSLSAFSEPNVKTVFKITI